MLAKNLPCLKNTFTFKVNIHMIVMQCMCIQYIPTPMLVYFSAAAT